MAYGDLLDAFLKVRSSLGNLQKDVDEKDPREKTDTDLSSLSVNFQDLLTTFKSMQQSDLEQIYQEVMELASGKETFQEYIRDVNKILENVRQKAQKNETVRTKIEDNLPKNLQDEDIDSLLANYQDTVNKIHAWQKQIDQKTSARR